MNSLFPAVVVATALFATGAIAQTDNATPAPAAPAVTASAPAAPAPVMVTPTPNEIIYLPRLPEPAELTNAAAAQGITVQQISQSSAQVMVVYRYADGQTHTVAYQLLPVAGSAPATTAAVTSVPAAPGTVVYSAPSAVYVQPPYYYYDPFYYPWPWFGGVSLRIGGGYYHGFRHFGGGYGFRNFGGGHGFHHR